MDWGEIAQHRLDDIARCSLDGPGVTRFPFTPEHTDALEVIRAWMERAGLSPHLDAAGTLVGRSTGSGPAVLIGSHQDSVRNAGRYDGIMGIALACLALEKLRSEGVSIGVPIEVLAFADEEGVRFPTALLGPRALAGTVDRDVLAMTDQDGASLGASLDAFGGNSNALETLARKRDDVRCYLELHIEQGPVLETANMPVGVVTGICGIERNRVTFYGETGHAGTVPMQGRADALVAAADFISHVHDTARADPDIRATIGTCAVSPGVANGIPDKTELTFEVRAPDDGARQAFAAKMDLAAKTFAGERGGHHVFENTYHQPAVPCAEDIIDRLSEAVMATGLDPVTLPSGATHDASAMADLCDIGMLFVRCRDGVSHRPEEFASVQDMGMAIDVLAHALSSFQA